MIGHTTALDIIRHEYQNDALPTVSLREGPLLFYNMFCDSLSQSQVILSDHG